LAKFPPFFFLFSKFPIFEVLYLKLSIKRVTQQGKPCLNQEQKTRESTKKTRFQKLRPPMVGNQLEKEIQESQK